MPELTLDLTAPRSHRLGVTLRHQPRQTRLELSLPQWTPGSYLIRNYVQRLEGLELLQGARVLPLRRLAVNRWLAELPSLDPIELHYRVLAPELSVRTCHLDDEHGFVAMAALALGIEGERWRPHGLQLLLPPGWRAYVPLPERPQGGWLANDYDHLIDTPIETGPHPHHAFAVAGVPHRWVEWGGDLAAEDPRWLDDVAAVCQACCRLMGVERPAADDYLFILHRTDQGYGGLEHDGSSVLQFGRRALAKPDGRRKLLQLVAHEYLHQWNVCRLRPRELVPYAYDQAVIVPSLWFAEGVTSYLDLLLPHAAGLTSEAEVLEDLGAELSRYLRSPGRQVQSLQVSSEEAWVKLYLADAHGRPRQISYYLKGAVLALVLDLRLRARGSDLPAVLQRLWRSHGQVGRGYGQQELIAAFAEHDAELAALLPQWLTALEDPPLQEALAQVGLRLEPERANQPFWGWQLEATPQGLLVQAVEPDSPAEQAGLSIGDELLALEGLRLRQSADLALALGDRPPSGPLELLAVRDGRVRRRTITPAAPAVERWRLVRDSRSSRACAERRANWLQLRGVGR